MCGILAIATARGGHVTINDGDVVVMRDRMAHRGPDGAGLRRDGHVVTAHRRLAVIDPTPAGSQPMHAEGCTLTYNGELYNEPELRDALAGAWTFRTACDTETVLAALVRWGADALARFRGMFALAFHDARDETLLLARDPLGVKPLYWWRGRAGDDEGESIVCASEIGAIVAHPHIPAEPDLAGISAYLTTIRTTVGERTMYRDVRSLRPGESLRFSLSDKHMPMKRGRHWPAGDRREREAGAQAVRETMVESVRRHCRADVPTCALLSGGLDSSIIVHAASGHVDDLRTYCSGTPGEGEDFEHARLVAGFLGVTHVEAPVDRRLFEQRWPALVRRLGRPLSTPNEVAINEVARTLRAEGHVVTLSGEGADELFGGYGPAMAGAHAHVEAGDEDPALAQLALATWIPIEGKAGVLDADLWHALDGDGALLKAWRGEFDDARACGPLGDPLQAHLRCQRRINLTGLLERLDAATMLESVEGRTPFADRVIADMAERLPMRFKFGAPHGTKRVLRDAFSLHLPAEVVTRQKASFPLPFQSWMEDHVEVLRDGSLARSLFSAVAIETVASRPERLWNLAWPMMNVAMWGESAGIPGVPAAAFSPG